MLGYVHARRRRPCRIAASIADVPMPKFKVLLTDYAWADLEIERRMLAEIDAELVVVAAAGRRDVWPRWPPTSTRS